MDVTPVTPESTTTTTAAPTTTTEAPTTTVAEVAPVVEAVAPVAPQTEVMGITAARSATLPATGAGSTTPWLAGMSALLLAVGAGLAGQGRRLARRSA